MIAKMKKYSFLVYHKEYETFLQKLRDLGVLHVQAKDSGIPEDEGLMQQMQQNKKLHSIKTDLEKRETEDLEATATQMSGAEVAESYETLSGELESLNQQLAHIDKDYAVVAPWGQFEFAQLDKLAENGVDVKFFSCQAARFKDEWSENENVFQIASEGSTLYFVQVVKEGDEVIDADPVKLPTQSLRTLSEEKAALEAKVAEINVALDQLAASGMEALDKAINESSEQVDFSKVVLGTETQAEDRLMILEGWVPVEEEQALNTFIKNEKVLFEVREANLTDEVPVKLRNNQFSRLFESIGELYTLPNHRELDLTPFFAPFYMLFFGFCLGDAGYGLLIMLGTLFGLTKVSKKLKPLMTLGFLLGISTTIMGVVGGTFFGIMFGLDANGEPLHQISWLLNYQKFVLNNDNMMILALGLGYIQVIFGMFLKAVNQIIQFGWKYAVSQFGWIMIIMFTIPFYGMGTMDLIPVATANKIALITGIVGAIPALLYNSPGKNIFLNFGNGLWETYGMASGLLGDVLSYIRLFALGISSAILGNVFNTLAIELSPDLVVARQLVMVLILLFGHSLNFFMAALGSFVHPLRLTFVEFYKNAGFEGGGRKYNPFSKVEVS